MKKLDAHGFTLPELIVMMVVSALFVNLIFVFTFGYWRYGFLQESDLDTLTSRLNAGDTLREHLGQSSGLILQNSIPDTHTASPDPSIPSGLYWQTIHAIPGNKPVTSSGYTPLLYFRQFSQRNDGTFIMNGAQPYEDEYVVYMDNAGKQLLLRSLANSSAVGNRLKTSCPKAQATNICPADRTIVNDLASVDMRYFSRSGNLLDYTSVWDSLNNQYAGPDFTSVEVVELTLNLAKKPIFQQTNATQNTTIIRIALRNN